MNIKAAHAAKIEKHLSTPIRYNGVFYPTTKAYLQHLKTEGATPQTALVPELMYNRQKYNRMAGHLQDEYFCSL